MKYIIVSILLGFTLNLSAQSKTDRLMPLQYESAHEANPTSNTELENDACDFDASGSEIDFMVKEGALAIPFAVNDIDGNRLTLADLRGKVVAINFWFADCLPCQMEMPDLNEMVAEFQDEDVVFIGMALDSKERLNQFLKDNPFLYQVVPGCKDIVTAYGISTSPGHVVIGKDSKVKYTSQGLTSETVFNLHQAIAEEL